MSTHSLPLGVMVLPLTTLLAVRSGPSVHCIFWTDTPRLCGSRKVRQSLFGSSFFQVNGRPLSGHILHRQGVRQTYHIGSKRISLRLFREKTVDACDHAPVGGKLPPSELPGGRGGGYLKGLRVEDWGACSPPSQKPKEKWYTWYPVLFRSSDRFTNAHKLMTVTNILLHEFLAWYNIPVQQRSYWQRQPHYLVPENGTAVLKVKSTLRGIPGTWYTHSYNTGYLVPGTGIIFLDVKI